MLLTAGKDRHPSTTERQQMATKKLMTEKQDDKMDKKAGIKENSPRDMKQDKKAGIKEDFPPKKAKK